MEVYTKEEKDKLIKELEKKHKEILEKKLKELEAEYRNKKYQEELEKKLYEKEKENKREKYKEELEKKLKELQEKQEATKYQEELEKKLKELETKKDKNCNSDSNCCQELLKSIKNSKENNRMSLECFKESKIWNRKLKEVEEKNKKETDKKIQDLKMQLKQLEKNIIKNPWVIGEYKWMPIGSPMPEGWVKIRIEQGYTLVQGIKEGITNGDVRHHSHYVSDDHEKGILTVKNIYYKNIDPGNPENNFTGTVKTTDDVGVEILTKEDGNNLSKKQKNNLAAGMYAELWQYQGPKKEYICCKKIITNPYLLKKEEIIKICQE